MLPEPDLSPIQCLDALELNLKTVLLHTGSALSLTSNFDATNITLTKGRVRESLPLSLDGFHRALGDLELELVRSRSVLHRDLAVSREQLAQRFVSSAATQSENHSRTLATSWNIDPGTAMAEAPPSTVLSHAMGPPSPLHSSANIKGTMGIPATFTYPPADDPLAHSKPSELGAQTASRKSANHTANSQDQTGTTKDESNVTAKEVEASVSMRAGIDNGRNIAGVVDEPNEQRINESSQANHPNQLLPEVEISEQAPEVANQDVGVPVSNAELCANNSSDQNTNNNSFKIDGLQSTDAFNTTSASVNADNIEDGYSEEFSADLPDGFLQNDAGDGNSFEEQFDFSTFDFGTSGEGDRGDANGESQNWDSNFFDESLFNLDGGTGD